jgi:hypothetical protein
MKKSVFTVVNYFAPKRDILATRGLTNQPPMPPRRGLATLFRQNFNIYEGGVSREISQGGVAA